MGQQPCGALLFLSAFLFAFAPCAVEAKNDWPMVGGGPKRSSFAVNFSVQGGGHCGSIDGYRNSRCEAAIGGVFAPRRDGFVIYASCLGLMVWNASSGFQNVIYFWANDPIVTSPILGENGVAFVGVQSGALYAVDTYKAGNFNVHPATWSPIWGFNASAAGPAITPALDSVGRIYVFRGSTAWVLNASTGEAVYNKSFLFPFTQPPLIDADGSLFFNYGSFAICRSERPWESVGESCGVLNGGPNPCTWAHFASATTAPSLRTVSTAQTRRAPPSPLQCRPTTIRLCGDRSHFPGPWRYSCLSPRTGGSFSLATLASESFSILWTAPFEAVAPSLPIGSRWQDMQSIRAGARSGRIRVQAIQCPPAIQQASRGRLRFSSRLPPLCLPKAGRDCSRAGWDGLHLGAGLAGKSAQHQVHVQQPVCAQRALPVGVLLCWAHRVASL